MAVNSEWRLFAPSPRGPSRWSQPLLALFHILKWRILFTFVPTGRKKNIYLRSLFAKIYYELWLFMTPLFTCSSCKWRSRRRGCGGWTGAARCCPSCRRDSERSSSSSPSWLSTSGCRWSPPASPSWPCSRRPRSQTPSDASWRETQLSWSCFRCAWKHELVS